MKRDRKEEVKEKVQNRFPYLSDCFLSFYSEDVSDLRCNLICHSMGGLDARYFVSKLNGHNLVVMNIVSITK